MFWLRRGMGEEEAIDDRSDIRQGDLELQSFAY